MAIPVSDTENTHEYQIKKYVSIALNEIKHFLSLVERVKGASRQG
jgi:hypothetical protein